MKFACVYATTEGQTRKILRHVADRLVEQGQSVELVPAEAATHLDLARFDAAILGGSVHAGQVQKSLRAFAADHKDALNRCPTLYLQVSLAAAGKDADDLKGIRDIAEDLIKVTGWTPGQVAHVAGAFRFSEYTFLESWVMGWIARQKAPGIDRHSDTEFTDWAALDRLLDDWTSAMAVAST
ncbi:MAG: flavodoxin domain-containing protein [Pseudomonadota bacterium]